MEISKKKKKNSQFSITAQPTTQLEVRKEREKGCRSRTMGSGHLPWLPSSRYFFFVFLSPSPVPPTHRRIHSSSPRLRATFWGLFPLESYPLYGPIPHTKLNLSLPIYHSLPSPSRPSFSPSTAFHSPTQEVLVTCSSSRFSTLGNKGNFLWINWFLLDTRGSGMGIEGNESRALILLG